MSEKLSHIKDGSPQMVDVSEKQHTVREAKAQAVVTFPTDVWTILERDGFSTPKGAITQTASIAGVMAAKQTGHLIPLCHPLPITHCDIQFEIGQQQFRIIATTRISAGTGVEMEALTAASVAALTIYDMTKALSHDIRITDLMLLEKTGGKKDFHRGK